MNPRTIFCAGFACRGARFHIITKMSLASLVASTLCAVGCLYFPRTPSDYDDYYGLRERAKKQLNFDVDWNEVQVIDEHTAEVSGRIVDCHFYEDRVLRRDWTPREIKIKNPYGPDTTATVSTQGEFRAKVRTGGKYFFKVPPPPPSKLLSVWSAPYGVVGGKILTVGIVNTPENLPTQWRLALGSAGIDKVYLYDLDPGAKSAVHSLIGLTSVQVTIRDKITHLPVAPKIRVTGTQVPSDSDLHKMLRRELGGESLDKKALELLPKEYLRQGETVEESAQAIDFRGLVGATYKIETIHGKYYYFSGFLKPGKAPVCKKTILLVEKGTKTRLEHVKEGEGGEMVDD